MKNSNIGDVWANSMACHPEFIFFPEFIQLLDDDIVSLVALTLVVGCECRNVG